MVLIRLDDHTTIYAKAIERPLMPYADNEGPDQTAHLRSLIWAFIVRVQM